MTKANLEHEINNWLQSEFVDENKILVEEIFYKKNLSKENNERLRHVNNIDLLDFVTDYAVLVNVNNKYEIGLINRHDSSIGVREIGEMQVYCRIASPIFAFLISSKGFSSEVSNFLLNDSIVEKLFSYQKGHLIGFQMVESSPNYDSILPMKYRKDLWVNLNS